jgi:ribosomal-protein-alanine N-acetyltransferase
MKPVPALETKRLFIRPFTIDDLDAVHQLLDRDLMNTDFGSEGATTREARKQWLEWTILSYAELAALNQPPYGDRAIVLKQTQQFIGACGFVPSFAPFGLLPSWRSASHAGSDHDYIPAFGLFYALSPAYQRQGYATEAAQALIDYAFRQLHLQQIVATTTYDNLASIGVMRKVGMHIEKNPYPDPPWFQVAGILENNAAPSLHIES